MEKITKHTAKPLWYKYKRIASASKVLIKKKVKINFYQSGDVSLIPFYRPISKITLPVNEK